jgi:hypothetical protein
MYVSLLGPEGETPFEYILHGKWFWFSWTISWSRGRISRGTWPI